MPNPNSEYNVNPGPVVTNDQPRDTLKIYNGAVPNFDSTLAAIITKEDPEMSRRRVTMQAAPADGSSVGKIAGAVTSQTALLIGVLYYFGWVYTQAVFAYFGIDTTLIGYGIPDYVLRSVAAAFRPFACTALIALILLGIHRLATRRGLSIPERRWAWEVVQLFIIITHLIGIFLVIVVIAGLLMPDRVGQPLGTLLPLALMVGVVLLGYVTYLRSAYSKELAPDFLFAQSTVANQNRRPLRRKLFLVILKWAYCTRLMPRAAPLHSRIQVFILLALGLLGMLWWVSLYANQVGTAMASSLAADLPYKPAVEVYSTERIAIAGPGVKGDEIVQPGNKYHFRYSGLRLLVHAADKYLLLPKNWQRGRDMAFIVRDNDSIRIDVRAL